MAGSLSKSEPLAMGHSPRGGGALEAMRPPIVGETTRGGPLVQGLIHLHRTLGYALLFLALANVAAALSVRQSPAQVAKVVGRSVRYGILMGGRFVVLTGVIAFALDRL